jgi:hypothetical protein
MVGDRAVYSHDTSALLPRVESQCPPSARVGTLAP